RRRRDAPRARAGRGRAARGAARAAPPRSPGTVIHKATRRGSIMKTMVAIGSAALCLATSASALATTRQIKGTLGFSDYRRDPLVNQLTYIDDKAIRNVRSEER